MLSLISSHVIFSWMKDASDFVKFYCSHEKKNGEVVNMIKKSKAKG